MRISMKYLVEIRPGEGGTDAKLLVSNQANIYLSFASRLGASVISENRGSL
jgi:protein subunit release factor A